MALSKESKGAIIGSAIGFAATAAAAVVIPLILIKSELRSSFFWLKIAWAEFLVILVWVFWGAFFVLVLPAKGKRTPIAGVLPALGISVLVYAIVSLAIMLLQTFLPTSPFTTTYHLVIQIVLALATVAVGIGLYFAVAAASTEPLPEALLTPRQLGAIIELQEGSLRPSPQDTSEGKRRLHEALKFLREKISYSLSETAMIAQSSQYQAFVDEVKNLCNQVQLIDLANSAQISQAIEKAEALRRKVDLILVGLKR